MTKKIDEELIERTTSICTEKNKKEEIKIDNRINWSDNFIIIERRYISKPYASNILDEAEWHKLMHFQLMINFNFGNTFVGRNDFKDYYPCGPKSYKNICKTLEDKGLIVQERLADRADKSNENKLTITKVLLAPLYDPETEARIPQNITKTSTSIDFMMEHYAKVPKECLEEMLRDMKISIDCKKLLILLYRFNAYKLFLGVDPNLVYRVENEVHIHPRAVDSLQLSEYQIKEMIGQLETGGYIFWKAVQLYEECFDQDCRLRVSTKKVESSWEAEIITPVYQWKGRSA
jgi:hypothetical protein